MNKSTWWLFGAGCVGSPLSFSYLTLDKSPFWSITLFVICVVMALIGAYYWISGDTEEA